MKLTNNTTVLFIDQQAHQGGHRREEKESVGEHLTNTYNSPLGRSRTHDLGCSLGYPLTIDHGSFQDIGDLMDGTIVVTY